MPKQVKCPKCKTAQPISDKCVSCGLDFREYARKLKEKRAAEGSAPRRIRCPECRKVQSMGEKCVDCGLDFKEYARKKKEERESGVKPEPEKPTEKPAEEEPKKKPAPKKIARPDYRGQKPLDIKVPVLEREPELSSIGELLGTAWIIYRERALTLMGLFLLALIVGSIPYVTSVFVSVLALPTTPATLEVRDLVVSAGIGMTGCLVSFFVFLIFFGGVISAANDETQKFSEALSSGWRNMLPLFWLFLLLAAVIQGGLFLLIVPGLVWTVSFFAAPFVLFEDKEAGMSAVLRSRAYIKGHWWAVFWRVLLVLIIFFSLLVAIGVTLLIAPSTALLILAPVLGIASLLWCLSIVPFIMVYLSLLFKDLKVIKGKNWRFYPSGGSKAVWGAIALMGVLVPLGLMVGGAIKLDKSGLNTKALESFVAREFELETEGEQVPVLDAPIFGADIKPELNLDKAEFTSGERITVTFRAPSNYPQSAWVGIIPSSVAHGSEEENDRHDLAYFYIKGQTSGEFVFAAPVKPGIYDVRMHDSDDAGAEVASVTFAVESGDTGFAYIPQKVGPHINTLKSDYVAGEPIEVEFSGLPGNEKDWITFVKASDPDNTFGEWFFTEGKSSGKHSFKGVPAGEYEVRVYFDWPNGGYEVHLRHGITIGEK